MKFISIQLLTCLTIIICNIICKLVLSEKISMDITYFIKKSITCMSFYTFCVMVWGTLPCATMFLACLVRICRAEDISCSLKWNSKSKFWRHLMDEGHTSRNLSSSVLALLWKLQPKHNTKFVRLSEILRHLTENTFSWSFCQHLLCQDKRHIVFYSSFYSSIPFS